MHTITIEKKPESIVAAIRFFEMEYGENYLEYSDFFADASTIMQFAYEKEYITEEKFNFWREGFNNNELGSEETFEVIIGEDEEWEPYCISYEDEDSDKSYNEQYTEALMVYGELVCSKDAYYNEFVKVLKEKEEDFMVIEN